MKPFEQQNHYELLEVQPSATPEQIHAAYERALEFYSPDSVAVYALVDPEQLDSLRLRLTEAMEALTNPEQRAEYDRTMGFATALASAAGSPVTEVVPGPPAPGVPEAAPAPVVSDSVTAPTAQESAPAQAAQETVLAATAAEAAPAPIASDSAPVPVAQEADPAPRAAEAAPVASGTNPTPVTREVSSAAQDAPAPVAAEPAPASVEPPAFPSLSLTFIPRSRGGLNSAAFFSSFSLPVRPSTPSPAESAQSVMPEGVEVASATPSAASPERAAESASPPVASPERAAEAVSPSAAPPERVAEPASPSAAPPERASEPVGGATGAQTSDDALTSPAPTAPAAQLTEVQHEVGSDEVTPIRLGSHRPAPEAPPAEAPAKAVPPPPEPAQPPSPPARAETPEPKAPPPAPARPSTSPAVETGLAQRPATRETPPPPRPRYAEIPPDAEFNGELLRRVRESRGYTLHQLAERTRISLRHLENIEADRYKDLPAQVYLRGILMNVARELALDPLRVSRSYLALVSKQ
ncbi:helix-turn-helix domain-containing protein [Myxococcaceae bacterium GXIMD 01537]